MSRKAPLLVILGLTLCIPAVACNYGKYGLTPGKDSQATVDGLFRGEYEKQRTWKVAQWREAAIQDQQAATDLPGKLDLAWNYYMQGNFAQADKIYQQLLADHPASYELLCSYATALQGQRRHTQAKQLLQKAIAQKPGFRHRAEEFHLDMINYEERAKSDPAFAKANIFVPQLTPLWEGRQGPEQNFSTKSFPEGLTSEGMAELLRQYPRYGEAWLALGMLLEHEKDFSMAVKAYDRALERGTAHQQELRQYLAGFREFGRAHDPGRVVGRGIVKLVIAGIALLIGLYVYRVAARVIWDISSHRRMKEEEKRRARRKDNSGPL